MKTYTITDTRERAGAAPSPVEGKSTLTWVCAWCFPGVKFPRTVTHGICKKHADEMLANIKEAKALWH